MGYKLAGYEVLGGVEIDTAMMKVYRANHHPEHSFLMPVQKFVELPDGDIPEELFDLDILDGSPPCSSFSISGSREKKWGKKTHFREGQAAQVLNDLFFDFIKIAHRLQPKVVIAENVKGLILGKARGYVKEIFAAFKVAGYRCQLFLLNASRMGVPQRRERTFFVASRMDLAADKLALSFAEAEIPFSAIDEGDAGVGVGKMNDAVKKFWAICDEGSSLSTVHPKAHLWNYRKLSRRLPTPTIDTHISGGQYSHPTICRSISNNEIISAQSFPLDFQYLNQKVGYICGMSVPPFMMQRIALEIGRQWFGREYSSRRALVSEVLQ
tara:strand:+ start:6619 stop:7593 length:975 start_codon:yes stop_codon:yes gene_type:complete